MELHELLEGIARDLHEDTFTTAPVCAFALAATCRLRVRHGDVQGALIDGAARDIILSPTVTRVERQHVLIAHEIAHWLLWEHGIDSSEANATYLQAALLLPRADVDRQLRTSWSITALKRAHPNASRAMIAARITHLRPAVASLFDGPDLRTRVASPWLGRPAPPRAWERELAQSAIADGAERVEDGPSVAAPIAKTLAIVVTRRWWSGRADVTKVGENDRVGGERLVFADDEVPAARVVPNAAE